MQPGPSDGFTQAVMQPFYQLAGRVCPAGAEDRAAASLSRHLMTAIAFQLVGNVNATRTGTAARG